MPLEIRELHIRTVIGTEKDERAPATPATQDEDDREALVAECVAQVMERLKENAER